MDALPLTTSSQIQLLPARLVDEVRSLLALSIQVVSRPWLRSETIAVRGILRDRRETARRSGRCKGPLFCFHCEEEVAPLLRELPEKRISGYEAASACDQDAVEMPSWPQAPQ